MQCLVPSHENILIDRDLSPSLDRGALMTFLGIEQTVSLGERMNTVSSALFTGSFLSSLTVDDLECSGCFGNSGDTITGYTSSVTSYIFFLGQS